MPLLGISCNQYIPRNHVYVTHVVKQFLCSLQPSIFGIHVYERNVGNIRLQFPSDHESMNLLTLLQGFQLHASWENNYYCNDISIYSLELHFSEKHQSFICMPILRIPENHRIPRYQIAFKNFVKHSLCILHTPTFCIHRYKQIHHKNIGYKHCSNYMTMNLNSQLQFQ